MPPSQLRFVPYNLARARKKQNETLTIMRYRYYRETSVIHGGI